MDDTVDERDLSDTEKRRLRRLLARQGSSDYELDLTGLDLAHAVGSVDLMVERQRFRSEERQVTITIDPATAESGETLFGPLGRHLLQLMRRGLIARVTPLSPDRAAGFAVVLPAGKEKTPEAAEGAETLSGLAPESDGDDPPPGVG